MNEYYSLTLLFIFNTVESDYYKIYLYKHHESTRFPRFLKGKQNIRYIYKYIIDTYTYIYIIFFYKINKFSIL